MRLTPTIAAGLLLAGGALGLGAAAAPADHVPHAVQRWFDTTGVAFAHSLPAVGPESSTDPVLGAPREVFRFSDAFAAGSAGDPLVTESRWIAPAVLDGRVVGAVTTLTLTPRNASPSAGAVSSDVRVAQGLAVTGGRLVEEVRSGAWYRVDDGRITAVNAAAEEALPAPESLTAFRVASAARITAAQTAAAGLEASVGGASPAGSGTAVPWGPVALLSVVVAGGAAVGVRMRWRRRRPVS